MEARSESSWFESGFCWKEEVNPVYLNPVVSEEALVEGRIQSCLSLRDSYIIIGNQKNVSASDSSD